MPQFELGSRCSPDSTANATNFRHAVFAKEPALRHEVSLLLASTLGTASVNALRADRAPDFVTAYLLCAKQAA
jgi:hypothetical protein